MSISLSETLNDQLQIQSLFPVHIMLARLLSDVPDMEVALDTKSSLLSV